MQQVGQTTTTTTTKMNDTITMYRLLCEKKNHNKQTNGRNSFSWCSTFHCS